VRPGPDFDEVADDVWVHRLARLEVERFSAGRGTVVNGHARVFGTEVRLGRECWIDEYATIGGGSAFDPGAHLHAGDWLHLGNYSQVNIARGVTCGDEVGIGIGTRVFTHGAYLSEWDGYPVHFEGVRIGSRVWLPNAQVNPGVTIGDDVVVAAGSVVTTDIPARSMAGGIPAVVLRPLRVGERGTRGHRARVLSKLVSEILSITGVEASADPDAGTLVVEGACFSLDDRTISGPAGKVSEAARNQLRRRGIRFRFEPVDGEYRPWTPSG
jgi:acetyltransferase-like isoleucine patch superfamily enzyme